MNSSINIKIGGKAGEGIKVTGLILSKIFSRSGFSIFSYDEYPSLVRGGHNTFQVFVSSEKAHSQHKCIDILIALDNETVTTHEDELTKASLVLFDPTKVTATTKAKTVEVPWAELAEQAGGMAIMSNMVSLGALSSLCDLNIKILNGIIQDTFQEKGEKIVIANKNAAQAGYDYINKKFNKLKQELSRPQEKEQIVLTGNEAVSLGAIASGVKYFAAYPMTPATSILHTLASQAKSFDFVVNHTENEIAAINSCLGASAAGVRTMTATSGGGFCLMVEGLGMAGIAEIPVVVALSMRPGPATGLPTWTGQGDLKFAINAAQDEYPRIVLAPGNVVECFTLTKKAFELAEKYQVPVIVLLDKVLSESFESTAPFEAIQENKRYGFASTLVPGYKRYALSDTGVSLRPQLGQNNGASLIANSYEHGEDSLVTEDAKERVQQMDKRFQKLTSIKDDLWPLPFFGNKSADTIVIGFGSTLGPCLEALKELPEVAYLHFNYVWPFPKEQVEKTLSKAKRIFCIEGNKLGQLEEIIREQTGIEMTSSLRKYDGRPFYPNEIITFIKNN